MFEHKVDTAEAERFLRALFGEEREKYVEFKYLTRGGRPPGTQLVGPEEEWPWREIQAAQDDSRGVLVGVCPRHKPKDERIAVASVRTLWINVVAWAGELAKERALSRLQQLDAEILPSVVVGFAEGYQVYWLLEEEVALQLPRACPCDNGGVEYSFVNDLNVRLSLLADPKGERAIHRISELLPFAYGLRYAVRLPGTWDFFNRSDPTLCRIAVFEPERRYNLETLDKGVPPLSELGRTGSNDRGMQYVEGFPR